MRFACSDVFLAYFFTFGFGPVSECLPKESLGSEEPQYTSQQRKGKKIYFKTLHRTPPKKVSTQDSLSLPDSVSPSFPLSLEFPNLTLSLFHICSIFLSADYSASLSGFQFLFPPNTGLHMALGCHAAHFGNSS